MPPAITPIVPLKAPRRGLHCRPPSQSRDDHHAVLTEVVRQPAGEAAGRRRCIARADDRGRLAIEQIEVALGDQQRRCIFELREQSRIQSLPEGEKCSAELLDLAISRSASSVLRIAGALPPPRRAKSGTAASAAAGVPKRSINWR